MVVRILQFLLNNGILLTRGTSINFVKGKDAQWFGLRMRFEIQVTWYIHSWLGSYKVF